jgi:hypothetical protein
VLRLLTVLPRSGGPRLVAALLGALALGLGCGLAVAAVGGLSIPQLGINVPVPAEKAAALERLASVATTDSNTLPAPPPKAEPHPIPARLLGPAVPVPVAPSLLQPRNGWLVSNGRTLVAVYAGAAGSDRSVGRVVIIRQDLLAGKQAVRILDARSTGPLTITRAPLGSSVETSAQAGSIRLRTDGGQQFVLDLRSGTGKVSLDPYKPPLP